MSILDSRINSIAAIAIDTSYKLTNNYYDKNYLTTVLASVDGAASVSSLSQYYTKTAVGALLTNYQTKGNYLTSGSLLGYALTSSILTSFLTSGSLIAYLTSGSLLGYLTSGSLLGYATTGSIPTNYLTSGSLVGYATTGSLASLSNTLVDNYYNRTATNGLLGLKQDKLTVYGDDDFSIALITSENGVMGIKHSETVAVVVQLEENGSRTFSLSCYPTIGQVQFLTEALAEKAQKENPVFIGTVTAPTFHASNGVLVNGVDISNTYAPRASPIFTGGVNFAGAASVTGLGNIDGTIKDVSLGNAVFGQIQLYAAPITNPSFNGSVTTTLINATNGLFTGRVTAASCLFTGGVTAPTLHATSGVLVNGININSTYAPIANPTFTGAVTAPTFNATSSLKVNGVDIYTYYAPKANPTFTGTVSGPTFHASSGILVNGANISNTYAAKSNPQVTGTLQMQYIIGTTVTAFAMTCGSAMVLTTVNGPQKYVHPNKNTTETGLYFNLGTLYLPPLGYQAKISLMACNAFTFAVTNKQATPTTPQNYACDIYIYSGSATTTAGASIALTAGSNTSGQVDNGCFHYGFAVNASRASRPTNVYLCPSIADPLNTVSVWVQTPAWWGNALIEIITNGTYTPVFAMSATLPNTGNIIVPYNSIALF